MNQFAKLIAAALATAALAGAATTAFAQGGAVAQAIDAGIVGETAEGYLGFAREPSAEVRAQVDAINIGRRSAYSDLAAQRGVTRQQVGAETGCSRLSSVNAGQAYQLRDGQWRTSNGSVPTPDYC